MSALARTALRLAAVRAFGADPVIAGLCGGADDPPKLRIFDSRIEDFDASEPVPLIIVLTEEMEGDAWSANNGGPPFDDHCDLVLEIAARAVEQEPDADAYLWTPETNAELEAVLDALEERAVHALTVADTPQSRLVRQAVTKRISKQKSMRYVSADSAAKAAMRQLTLTAQLKGDGQRDARELAAPVLAATPSVGNTGDGALTFAAPGFDDRVIKGNYVLAFTSPTEFTLTDPNGNPAGSGVCGAPFAHELRFTVVIGGEAWVAGDQITIAVSQDNYAALPQPLRAVCEAMPEDSYGARTCDLLAAAFGSPRPIEFFTGADLTVAPQPGLKRHPAPIEPGQPGAEPSFGVTVEIPPPEGE